jgi:hypothetical protein
VTRYKTIKEYAQHLLLFTDFVDCYGRRVGLHYDVILERIRREFPRSRTTKRALRYILHYQLDRAARLPARHRSRRILSREYARSLLVYCDSQGVGLSLSRISRKKRDKFPFTPSISARTLQSWEDALKRENIAMPERRA